MAQTKPKAGQFYGVSDNGTDGQFLKTDGTGGMSWDSPITNPTITSIDYPGSATAADPAGGESVIINGTLFASGITCTVGGTSAVTAFNSATQITITTPAKAAGQYAVAVTNPDGGTVSQANFIQYSGVPVWSTASGNIGSVQSGSTASFQVTATEGSDTIEYAVTTGSLPSGLSLNTNTGAITGTAPSVSASTTTTFSITATDDENQTSSARSFNITVTPDVPSNHFNTVLYTGTGAAKTITTGFQGDLTVIKPTSNADVWSWFDSLRTFNNTSGSDYSALNSDNDSPEGNTSASPINYIWFNDYTPTGFTLGTDPSERVNKSGWEYVSYTWKAGGAAVANNVGTTTSQVSANNTLGFSIVSYTGAGVVNVGHGLSSSPDLIISKITNASSDWVVYNSVSGTGKYLVLNSGASITTDAGVFPSVTNSTFTHEWSGNSYQYINYCFTSKPGFSKVGSYVGNTTNLPIVSTGFEPAFLMIKITTGTDSWFIVDNKRSTSNPRGDRLFANSSAAEANEPGAQVNFLNGGFQITGSGGGAGQTNSNGQTYLYIAFAADPSTTTPSLANSFSTITYSGNGGTQSTNSLSNQAGTIGFAPDLTWIKTRSNVDSHFLWDTLRGANEMIIANSTGPQYNRTGVTAFNSNGFTLGNYGGVNSSGYTYVAWNWKAGGSIPSINGNGTITSLTTTNQAAGFSIVQHVSNNSNDTIGHGLSSAPELIFSKNQTNPGGWGVYNATSGTGAYLYLDTDVAEQPGGTTVYPIVNNTVFAPGSGGWNYGTGDTYIHYCFRSISGYSKVGSYTGTGVAGEAGSLVVTGFQPQFVVVKRIDAANSWVVSSTLLGYNDLYLNNSSAEFASGSLYGAHYAPTGFYFNTADQSRNISGGQYIYLAIA